MRRSHAAKKGPNKRGAMCLSINRKAGQKAFSASGLTNGKKAGTMIEMAKLESKVKVVRFCIEPPILPAMIGAAVAVGMMKQSIKPCAKTRFPVKR